MSTIINCKHKSQILSGLKIDFLFFYYWQVQFFLIIKGITCQKLCDLMAQWLNELSEFNVAGLNLMANTYTKKNLQASERLIKFTLGFY